MKRIFLAVLVSCIVMSGLQAQSHRCHTMEVLEQKLKNQPKGKDYYQNFLHAEKIGLVNSALNERGFNDTVVIPVVFHVIYKTTAQNLNVNRIKQQIAILNLDYARLNRDTVNTPDGFKPVAGGMPIKFVLATTDPDGNPTDGIIRVETTVSTWGTDDAFKFTSEGGSDAWPADKYLNVWSVNFGGGLLGYAQFPGGDPATDGVALLFKAVGINYANTPFHLGRTATHEVGHWLGLRHIWGDSFCGDDFVDDTPPQEGANFGCPDYPTLQSCSPNEPGIQFMNYMDYTDDSCYNMFSKGQVERMEYFLLTDRNTFLDPSELDYTDITFDEVLSVSSGDACSGDFNPQISVSNSGFKTITSFDITSEIDGVFSNTETITLNIEPGNTETVALTGFSLTNSGTYTLKLSIGNVNGAPDRFTGNNSGEVSFLVYTTGNLLPFSDGFEYEETLDEKGYAIENPDGDYTWEKFDEAGYDSDFSIFMDNYSYQGEGEFDYITLPPVDLSDVDSAFLYFDHAYYVYESSSLGRRADGLGVEVSIDCGENWTEVFYEDGDNLATVPGETTSEFVPETTDEWKNNKIDISIFKGYDLVLTRFYGFNDYGNNVYVDNINIEGIKITGVFSNVIDESMIAVFPNPASQKATLRINAKQNGNVTIQLQDVTGRILKSNSIDVAKGNQDIALDLKGYASGSYFVTISEGNYKITKKLLVY